ncbi:MAG: RNA methyltransferase [Bacteroidetes bacterium MedPE-SWsnd-G1]|nr:MAG: RNA methyltransferase [Bacteroidetes bacterium MedPE-SWsnd-G1]
MPYNEFLGDRIRAILIEKRVDFFEKNMFGGLCFMVDDKMCIGVTRDEVMARIGVDAYEDALKKPGCKEMNFTGRPMKGYVFLSDDATDMESDLAYWIQLALDFNPLAKASKKGKK